MSAKLCCFFFLFWSISSFSQTEQVQSNESSRLVEKERAATVDNRPSDLPSIELPDKSIVATPPGKQDRVYQEILYFFGIYTPLEKLTSAEIEKVFYEKLPAGIIQEWFKQHSLIGKTFAQIMLDRDNLVNLFAKLKDETNLKYWGAGALILMLICLYRLLKTKTGGFFRRFFYSFVTVLIFFLGNILIFILVFWSGLSPLLIKLLS